MEKFEENDNTQNNCLLYKLKSSGKDSDELSIDFYQDITTREKEFGKYRETKGKYVVRIYLKDVFEFADYLKMLHMA